MNFLREWLKTGLLIIGIGGWASLILSTILLMFIINPFLLITGIKLMGFDIEYTVWTFIGAYIFMTSVRGGIKVADNKIKQDKKEHESENSNIQSGWYSGKNR